VSWSADVDLEAIFKGFNAYDRGDYATALKEFTTLAEQGHALAQRFLGDMYAMGHEVRQDNVRAHMWWNIVASTGHEEVFPYLTARKRRNTVAKEMTPADISAAQKLARECVAKNYKGC